MTGGSELSSSLRSTRLTGYGVVVHNNQAIKRRIITAWFDHAEVRVAFLTDLARTGHEQEAMTLCLTYLDSFAQWLCWPVTKNGQNFVESLIRYGGDPLMGLAHPLLASRFFSEMKSGKEEWKIIGEKIGRAFVGRSGEVISISIFKQELALHLTDAELARVRPELWRSTIANVVYRQLRNPSVHNFGTSGGILFSQTTYQGEAFPALTFWQLLECTRGLVREARSRSEATWQWFGNSAIVGID